MQGTTKRISRRIALTALLITFGWPLNAMAHCDTLDGPVVHSARSALETGEITPLLKWVRSEDEATIRTAFQKTRSMRALGPEAEGFADQYFFETLVRIHRAGEGAPYTGLKPGTAVDPAVALADQALENGSVDKLVAVLTRALERGIRERFAQTHEQLQQAEQSIDQGREFVSSYVMFTHYVEGLHGLIQAADDHHAQPVAAVEGVHQH